MYPFAGLSIILGVQLILSLLAAYGWWCVARDPNDANIKRAAMLSASWFAVLAALIIFLFDFDILQV